MKKRILKKKGRPMLRLFTLILFTSGYTPKQQVQSFFKVQKRAKASNLTKYPIAVYSHKLRRCIGHIHNKKELALTFAAYDYKMTKWLKNNKTSRIRKNLKSQTYWFLAISTLMATSMPSMPKHNDVNYKPMYLKSLQIC